MSYAALTFEDRNPVKRWLQDRRLEAALRLVDPARAARMVDYGAGDGELCVRIGARWPEAEIRCFEPWAELADEARRRLAGAPRVTVVEDEAALEDGWAQTLFCLEVLEHLPPEETRAALDRMARALAPGGRLICGVPVEVGPPALAKGLFRRVRRPDDFDGELRRIAAAAAGRPPRDRPLKELAPGRRYHVHHLGFDHRALLPMIAERFRIVRLRGSPWGTPLPWLEAELYIVAEKA